MPEDVTAYGATPDDSSDDTNAFNAAAEAAAGGTVYIPEGTFTINSKSARGAAAVHLSDPDVAGTSFVGAGPDKTTVKMEGDHEYTHMAITYADGEDHDGAVVRNLTLDGDQWNQGPRPDGETPPNGFGIEVEGTTQNVLIENARLKDWSCIGGRFAAKGITVRDCSFLDCGAMVWDRGGWRGHGFNARNNASSRNERGLLCENCYFTGSSGTSIDAKGGNVTMRNCYTEDQQFAVKFNNGYRTTIENCRWRDLSHRGIYTVKDEGDSEILELNDVALENVGMEAIASKHTGSVVGNNVLINTANTEDNHRGEAIFLKDKKVDIDSLAVFNTENGGIFETSNSAGKVKEMVRNENAGGLGSTSSITIENDQTADSYAVSAPSREEVGVNTSSSSTSYDHTLTVEAESDVTYGITVSGEAKLGDQADSMESVSRTDGGNYLLEGKTLAGGSDSFEFSGEVLPDRSNIDGDGTAYVDGSQVDLSPGGSSDDSGSDAGFGSYTLPDPGSADWHQPLNDNFDQLGQDVQALNDRLNELENQIN